MVRVSTVLISIKERLHLAATELKDQDTTAIGKAMQIVLYQLIKEGAMVMQRDNQGDIPLFSAIIQYIDLVVKALLENTNQEQQRYQLITRNEQGDRPAKLPNKWAIKLHILKMYRRTSYRT